MGWSFRKSIRFGPFRVNLGKSGVGVSVGEKDVRVGINSRGRRYESVTIPGTGVSYRSSSKSGAQGSGCATVVVLVAAVVAFVVYELLFAQ
jgi:uncharacterized protein DUF4236